MFRGLPNIATFFSDTSSLLIASFASEINGSSLRSILFFKTLRYTVFSECRNKSAKLPVLVEISFNLKSEMIGI